MRHFIVLLFLFPLSLALNGQGFRVRHYLPNAQTNLSKAIFESSPGNYITGGIIVETVNNVTCNRLCLMGLNAQGQITWTKKYGNNKLEYLNNDLISRSFYKQVNNLYYAGCVRDSLNNQIGVLIKFNMNGDTLWQKIYRDPDPLEDVIPQMVTGSIDGGFLITGFFQNNSNNPYSECMLIKTDASGNELWRKKIDKVTPDTQDGKAIVQDVVSGKIVIVGYQYIGDANYWSMHDNVVITDSLGGQASRYDYTGFGGVLKDVIQTSDQNIVAVGYKHDPQTMGGNNLGRSFIVKFNINNPYPPIWELEYDKLTLANAFSCLVELQNGEMLVGGGIDTMQINNLNTNNFIRLTKINSNGTVTWNKNYDYKINSPTSDNLLGIRSINLTNDGSWIAAIECSNFPSPNPFFFVKFDSTGCDSTLAYCKSEATVTSIYENKFNNVKVDVFPNPVAEHLMVNVNNNGEQKDFQLQIMDVSGREVKQALISQEKNSIDLRGMNNGVYMVSIRSNNKLVYTTKLVKQD